MPVAGITHLIEHLCLYAVAPVPYDIDGWVDEIRTVLTARGSRDDILSFVAAVTAALSDLPLQRLKGECQVLLTEADSGGPGLWDYAMGLRYGTVGPGQMAQSELGLHRVTADEARDWTRKSFTAGNVALWMTTSPDGVTLNLPTGSRQAVRDPQPIPGLRLPAYDVEGKGRVVLAIEGDRSVALAEGIAIAERRLFRRLRLDAGISYDIDSYYDPVSARRAHAVVMADCMPGHAADVRDGVRRAVDELATEGPTGDELSWGADAYTRELREPNAVAGQLDNMATNELLGAELITADEILETLRQLNPDDVAHVLSAALPSAIMIAPESVPEPPQGYVPYDLPAVPSIRGRSHRPRVLSLPYVRNRFADVRSSPEGVSFGGPGEDPITIRFVDCEVLLYDDERSLTLVDSAGRWVELELDSLQQGDALVALLKESLPRQVFVYSGEAEDWIWGDAQTPP
jgi:zinc protease